MAEWTSLKDIMKDLTVAQGQKVPASLAAYGQSDAPTLNIEEETEEDYYKTYGDADFSQPPDLSCIQEMLTMVNDPEPNSNLNPSSPKFVPQSINEKTVIKNNKIKRNVAIASILQTQAQKSTAPQPDLKSPGSMFRKKSTPTKKEISATINESFSHSVNNTGQYCPSSLANEYYNKYVSNNKMKEQIKEDIWARAERQMKEIDERKRRISERSSSSSSQDLALSPSSNVNSSSIHHGIEFLSLLKNRHMYLVTDADCIVCQVAAKHGYKFEEE